MISPDTKLKKNEDGVWTRDSTEDDLRELLGDDPNILLDRKTMGMLVQVSMTEDDRFLLEAETNACHKIAEIPGDKILDAFYHPCLYVSDPCELFPKSKSL